MNVNLSANTDSKTISLVLKMLQRITGEWILFNILSKATRHKKHEQTGVYRGKKLKKAS